VTTSTSQLPVVRTIQAPGLLASRHFGAERVMEAWAAEEFEGAELGDSRLNTRLIKLAERLADRPTASIPGACANWAETQAAYRFFEQSSGKKRGLDWEDVLDPHIEADRIADATAPLVLCLQDTSVLASVVLGQIEFTLPARHGQAQSRVRQEFRSQRIELRAAGAAGLP